ncbi:PorP/SprF family type IX secretion system membrane protein [Croceiramulus getboli]|nr:PorP/SprF family type IX secretion system membrane protein [Flavobacteriaceae bacterium YJPT1-3]
MKQLTQLFLIATLTITSWVMGQESVRVPAQGIPSQNLLQYNRFLVNPTFSRVGQEYSYVSLYGRNQWVSFEDSPQLYMINYGSRVSATTGVAAGLYQQSNGILNYFGVNANYAYGIRMGRKSWLTLGTNFAYMQSGLKGSLNPEQQDDPFLLNYEETSQLNLLPGLNLTLGKFDFGVYANNLIVYDLKESELLTDVDQFIGHIAFTSNFGSESQNRIRTMVRGRLDQNSEINLSGNILADFSRFGWVQAGYDDYFGISGGLGVNLTPNVSLGYTIEKGLSNELSNLGATHEIALTYRFRNVSEEIAMEEVEDQIENQRVVDSLKVLLTEKEVQIDSLKAEMSQQQATTSQESLSQQQPSTKAGEEGQAQQEQRTRSNQVRQTQQQSTRKENDPQPDPLDTLTPEEIEEAQQKQLIALQKTRDYYARKIERREVDPKQCQTPKFAVKYLEQYEEGFYLIANVYKPLPPAERFRTSLKNKGYDSKVIQNPQNGYKYVSIKRYDSRSEAEQGYCDHVDGNYKAPMWLLEVRHTRAQRKAYSLRTAAAGESQGSAFAKANEKSRQPAVLKTSPVTKTSANEEQEETRKRIKGSASFGSKNNRDESRARTDAPPML